MKRAGLLLVLLGIGCTPMQRAIVRSVLDLAEAVCEDSDSVEECLHKCESEAEFRRSLERPSTP